MEIVCSKAGGVLTLQFNRAERKNAITAAMYQTLADALNEGEHDAAVRAIVLLGRPEVFTAGNDVDDFLKMSVPAAGGVSGGVAGERPVFQFMHALIRNSKPVVAAVSGAAVGIGTSMLLHCDLVYAADNAKFSVPYVQLGLCPGFASSLLFAQLAGYPRAAEKLMLGEAFSAHEAYEMGLVSKVLPADELVPFAERQAAKLVALPVPSLRATKRLMRAGRDEAVRQAMAEENKLYIAMLAAPEAKEALRAFFEKRRPNFARFG